MPQWPTGWQKTILTKAGIPATQFAIDVLSAWQKSTPTAAWTNNPLGMPYQGSGGNRALDTPYAMFHSMSAFGDSLARFMASTKGLAVKQVLTSGDSYSSAWREIHGLKWPASTTETDYPHCLLDKVESKYRAKLAAKTKTGRKSAGNQLASCETHEGMRAQAAALHHAATNFKTGTEAIRHIVRRLS